MAAAAIAVSLSTIAHELGGVLPPRAILQNAPRHGRSRGMSVKGKGGRHRGYSVVEERDVSIAKALVFVIKRAMQMQEVVESDECEHVAADPESWAPAPDLVSIIGH
ncbi:uncharacterized protein C8A04DRAFT_11910 [Dichotomopilus funicola]|uniref:Uncharacterized protein n=1 Tax=Dichotomopilus funicola TaxID=1934379 RepID=A0AAN6V3A3_9PEZI|nr:hypothetical protein C8A04DRAFT_11910 [Dichotomopilus funicola]